MKLNDRELATVLAALRNLQEDIGQYTDKDGWTVEDAFADHFTEHEPLSLDEIDDLCERLNCGEDES